MPPSPLQEAMELTQRKFLRQLVMYRHSTGHEDFPHLVLVDLLDSDKQGQGQGQEKEGEEAESCNETPSGEQEVHKPKSICVDKDALVFRVVMTLFLKHRRYINQRTLYTCR